MTTFYCDWVTDRITDKARKKLKKMPEKILTLDELREIFGDFNSGRPSNAENQDAFWTIVNEGLLIKISDDKYIVKPSDKNKKNAGDVPKSR